LSSLIIKQVIEADFMVLPLNLYVV
jgi:hypothetical protein